MPKKSVLNANHTLLATPHFPCSTLSRGGKRALLGIGGNMGDVVRRFSHLFCYFKRTPLVHVIETAPILKNPPFGYRYQNDFYNSLMLIETHLAPKALLRYILRVERLFGRKRLFKDGPRTLDIDMIFYENITMESKQLTLPHPGWMQRDSVLIPLSLMRRSTL